LIGAPTTIVARDPSFAFPHPADPEAWRQGMDPAATPPCSRELGLKVIEINRTLGTAVLEFNPDGRFLNPIGTIQGGIVAAMLDDTFSIAILAATDINTAAPTLEMKVSFFRSALPGKLTGRGRMVHMGKSTGFCESELYDEQGQLIAKASATVALRKA
jgi:uncharacterized protein (TIGR00369 family)